MNILVLNAGSSSHKSCLYEVTGEVRPGQVQIPLWEAEIEGIGQDEAAHMPVKTSRGQTLSRRVASENRPELISHMLETMWSGETQVIEHPGEIDIVGHRVVYGGRNYHESVRVTSEVKAAIAQLSELAPVHNPVNLQGIEIVEQLLDDVPQVAVFDTAFHAHLPDAAAIYPGPYEWVEQGIRRYGFHGISHEYCAKRAAQILGRDLASLRLINCHLGNGCSLAAIREGHSVETTMGFTPLDGLMMGSRSGSVDPGIPLYLIEHKGYSPNAVDHLLNHDSGLKGISGLTGDMRDISAARAQGNERAKLAFDIYVHRLRFYIAAMLPALGGLDALIFTAGVGENSAEVRAAVCQAFEFLGLRIDTKKNQGNPLDEEITAPEASVNVLVIQCQEDWAIAGECWKLVKA